MKYQYDQSAGKSMPQISDKLVHQQHQHILYLTIENTLLLFDESILTLTFFYIKNIGNTIYSSKLPSSQQGYALVRSNETMFSLFFIFLVNEKRKPFAYLARRSIPCSDDKARQEFEEVSFPNSIDISLSKNQIFWHHLKTK